jgi:hypothetical protein
MTNVGNLGSTVPKLAYCSAPLFGALGAALICLLTAALADMAQPQSLAKLKAAGSEVPPCVVFGQPWAAEGLEKGCTKDGAEGYFRSRPTGLTSGLFHSGLLSEIEIHAKRLPASRSGFAPRPLYPK